MAETIPDIDMWNARLDPPLWVNPDSSDSTEAEPGDCGCCAMPKCCPPELECQSLRGSFSRMGFLEFGDSASDGATWRVYHKQGVRTTRVGSGTDSSTGTSADCGYSSSTYSINVTQFIGQEVPRVYYGGIGYGQGSASTSASDSTGCPFWGPVTPTEVCTATGTSWIEYSETHCYSNGVDPPTPIYARSYRYEHTLSDAEGETTEDFTAWREIYPTDGDFNDAVTAYNQYLEDYSDWETAWNAWNDGGQVGDEPPQPDTVDPPLDRPDESYGPCWYKITTEITIDPHYFGYNSDGSSADDPDPVVFATWIEGGAIGEPPCSGVGEVYDYTNTPVSSMPSWGSPTTNSEVVYEGGVDKDEWIAIVQAVMDAAEFPSEGCMSDLCSASREIRENISTGGNDIFFTEQWFRYRWKLNKCCGLYSALSWLEVFYPQAFLDWLNSSSSDPAPVDDLPVVEPKSWEWTGIARPTECDNSNSADSIIGPGEPGYDAFDDETRWSPWSLVVKTPVGEEGSTLLRSLYMVCYRSDYGTKPDYIPLYGDYNPSDLNEDGTPDSQQ